MWNYWAYATVSIANPNLGRKLNRDPWSILVLEFVTLLRSASTILTETLSLGHHIPVRHGEWKRQIASRPATNAPSVHAEQCEGSRTNEINTAMNKETLESLFRLPIRLVINLDSTERSSAKHTHQAKKICTMQDSVCQAESMRREIMHQRLT